MDLAEQLQIGKDAEDFKRYIEEHPYFNGLVERVKLELAKTILELDPDKTESFTYVRSRMIGVDDILNAVSGDIYMGQQAYEKLNGLLEEPKGLL